MSDRLIIVTGDYRTIDYLYRVDRETDSRFYGVAVKGCFWSPKFVSKDRVFADSVTERQYDEMKAAEARRDETVKRARADAEAEFQRQCAAIRRGEISP